MSSWPWRRQLLDFGTLALLLAVAACGGGSSDPQIPSEITLDIDEITLVAAGQSAQLTASVLDQDGDPITDAPVEWASGDEGIVSVSATGLVIAQAPGTAQVTASAGAASSSASVIVQSTASLEGLEGDEQNGLPGEAVPIRPAVQVRSATNAPVAGVQVRFQVATGSGTVTGESQTTGADGVARVGSWRLGTGGGVNTLTATVDGAEIDGEPVQFVATASAYDITLRYLSNLTSAQRAAFEAARERWEGLIVGDLVDVTENLPANQCGQNPATNPLPMAPSTM